MKQTLTMILLTLTVSAHAQTWQPAKLGNIFAPGEEIVLPLTVTGTAADSVKWTLYDFHHHELAASETAAVSGSAVIKPSVSVPGYYLVRATVSGSDTFAAFAIIRPHAATDRDNPFGAMTHFFKGMKTDLLPLLKNIGVTSIRDEHPWKQIEKTKGEFVFLPKSDNYMRDVKAAGIDPLIVLAFGNKLYDGDGNGPSTPAAYEAFADYGLAILKHYGEQVKHVEVWNEYNGSWFPTVAKNPRDRAKYYTELAKVVYPKIKAARPDVTVLGCAAVIIPLPYFDGIFKLGGLDYMDAVVIHPYRYRPEGVDTEVGELQALIRQYNGGKDKPIWATETGYWVKEVFPWEQDRKMYEKTRAEAARYLARQYTLLLKQGVAKIHWYLASDFAEFGNMGLLRHHEKDPGGMAPLTVTPAFVAYANLIRHLDGAKFVRREAQRDYTRAYVELFDRGGKQVRVAWATRPAKIRLRATQPLTISGLLGDEKTAAPDADGGVTLDLNEETIYITGAAGGVEELDTGARVIADSLDDYSKNQGGNNWYYGYLDGADGDKFVEFKQIETMWGYEWGTGEEEQKDLRILPNRAHPLKRGGADLAPTLRWRSPVAGKLRVTGFWAGVAKGDGVTGVITVDGKEVSRVSVGGPTGEKRADVDLPVTVSVGSAVDFVVRPNANAEFDATYREFAILQEN
jgi:hypothetical protein